MNVKTEITLSERHLRLAEKMVEEGAFPSISSLVEAAVEQVDQIRHLHDVSNNAVSGMADEIQRRMELPKDQPEKAEVSAETGAEEMVDGMNAATADGSSATSLTHPEP